MAMRFFFPGPMDTIDPAYDFELDVYNPYRVRQQDELYAHELLATPPYHGIMLARSAVNPEQGRGRTSFGLWQRLLREGVRSFMRLDTCSEPMEVMGECGAYAYAMEPEPTLSIEEALTFYARCGVDYGLSVDHVIRGYISTAPRRKWRTVPPAWVERQQLTLTLAEEFLREYKAGAYSFEPVGVAQGWNPTSYADSVDALQRMGYTYIALGGLARISVAYILNCLEAVSAVRRSSTRLHLLGVARPGRFGDLARFGVVSFDSTTPLRQAFLNENHNYYAAERTYRALRVPQVTKNRQLRDRIAAGDIRARDAFELERAALEALRLYDTDRMGLDDALERVVAYEILFNKRDQSAAYRETLLARPWAQCSCAACCSLGIEIIMLRGKQRNNRRGFHNLYVFFEQLDRLAVTI